ncbi:DUF3800 domain-containing protein [Peptococcus simiae]|uniref:DUF3800 domain-containing protein n=1 Tax=Peptococcus simiae TaxID=1643805 RepID=UPI00398159EF
MRCFKTKVVSKQKGLLMNIYIDESGTINNKLSNEFFIITLVVPESTHSLKRSYKRFVSTNYPTLKTLDSKNRMFLNDKFHELKGSCFNRELKQKFIQHFSKKNNFSLFYIVADNSRLNNTFCSNSSRAFNYLLKNALEYFIIHGYLPSENHTLQLDERNERTESKYFLEDYLNTELFLTNINQGSFSVRYFDSANNTLIQVADVLSNLLYSHLKTQAYDKEINLLKRNGLLKFIYSFPL